MSGRADPGPRVAPRGEQDLSQPSTRPRMPVYIERDVVLAPDPTEERTRDARAVPVSGTDSLELLTDTHRVIVLGSDPLPDAEGLRSAETAAELPSPLPAGCWLITVDPAVCAGERPAGALTILVGPRRPPDRRPTARCDIEARDLAAAVMEILVRDAMS